MTAMTLLRNTRSMEWSVFVLMKTRTRHRERERAVLHYAKQPNSWRRWIISKWNLKFWMLGANIIFETCIFVLSVSLFERTIPLHLCSFWNWNNITKPTANELVMVLKQLRLPHSIPINVKVEMKKKSDNCSPLGSAIHWDRAIKQLILDFCCNVRELWNFIHHFVQQIHIHSIKSSSTHYRSIFCT